MGRRVVHSFSCDFDKLKKGDMYWSYCGKGYYAEDPPTPEQDAQIEKEWADVPLCQKCLKVKKNRKLWKGSGKKTEDM